MARWALHLFGNESLTQCGSGAVRLPNMVWPVLGCLLSAPNHRTTRSRLAAQLWPDESEVCVRHRFATVLWRIHVALSGHLQLLEVKGETVALTSDSALWIDAWALERRVNRYRSQPARLAEPSERGRLVRALRLYMGDFLPDRDQEWVVLERARLRLLYLDALHALAVASAQAGAWDEVRTSAALLCAAEPLREDGHRLLIEAHARCGNHALALQYYRQCETMLARELGVAPMGETQALAARVARANVAGVPNTMGASTQKAALLEARSKIIEALQIIDSALLR